VQSQAILQLLMTTSETTWKLLICQHSTD